MVVVREIEGKGKGLVAIRNISAGAVIFTEDPLSVYKKEVPGHESFKKHGNVDLCLDVIYKGRQAHGHFSGEDNGN